MTPPSSPEQALETLHRSEQRLLRTVDSLNPRQLAGPSVLSGWSRAHVVAHLALNAEGLAGALDGLAREHVVPVYRSNEARDHDIEALAQVEPSEIRARLFAAGQHLRDALETLDPPHWGGTVPRLPGGPLWPVASLPETRRREVEIHHADLDAGYSHGDWPEDFRLELLDIATADHASSSDSPDFTVHATDAGRSWRVGATHPVVQGTAADLGWWLVGRGRGEGLACSAGDLPRLGPWRRTPVR